MKYTKLVLASSAVLVLAGCNQIPSLNPSDLDANKAACESISSTWNSMTSALSDPAQAAGTLASFPQTLEQAGHQATDQQLDEAISQLSKVTQDFIANGQPDLSGLASATVGITARCAILGASIKLDMPQ